MKTDLINKYLKKMQFMLRSEKWIFHNKIGPFLGLAFVFGLFTALNPKIISLTALETMVQQTVISVSI